MADDHPAWAVIAGAGWREIAAVPSLGVSGRFLRDAKEKADPWTPALTVVTEAPPVRSGIAETVAQVTAGLRDLGHEVDLCTAADVGRVSFGEVRLTGLVRHWPAQSGYFEASCARVSGKPNTTASAANAIRQMDVRPSMAVLPRGSFFGASLQKNGALRL